MSTWFKKLILGRAYVHYFALDTALFVFDKLDVISIDKIAPRQPKNATEIFEELCNQQMIVLIGRSYRITAKGRACLLRGGFVGTVVREKISYLCIIIAAITGIISVLLLFK